MLPAHHAKGIIQKRRVQLTAETQVVGPVDDPHAALAQV
jgi:hypothetical protein